jgi:hypothetical protein
MRMRGNAVGGSSAEGILISTFVDGSFGAITVIEF